jgi:Cu-Zn family superoxide dismutase
MKKQSAHQGTAARSLAARAAICILPLVLLAGCMKAELAALSLGQVAWKPGEPLTVRLKDADGVERGVVTLSQQNMGLRFQVEVKGLEPGGVYAFHVHEKPVCRKPDFSSAGAHFNPYRAVHGFLDVHGPHAGDLPNLVADASGRAVADFTTNRLSLRPKNRNSVLRGRGTSLIVHTRADDYFSKPAGDAGERLLCGEVTRY